MEYLGDAIDGVRRDTRNEDVPSAGQQVGIQTSDIVRYYNFAQSHLTSLILNTRPQSLQTEVIMATVAGQEEYEIQDRLVAGERILAVWYSIDGNLRNYVKLKEVGTAYRNTNTGYPYQYIRRNGKILLNLIPNTSSGTIRVVYERPPDDLALRAGLIDGVTVTDGVITTLNLDTTDDDEDNLLTARYLCVSTADGNVTAYNIPISGYDTTTGAVTISGGAFTLGDGETVSAGSYVTVGKYTSTHSQLPDECARYLDYYTIVNLFFRDSDSDAEEWMRKLKESEETIIKTFQGAQQDELEVQLSDPSLVIGGEYY